MRFPRRGLLAGLACIVARPAWAQGPADGCSGPALDVDVQGRTLRPQLDTSATRASLRALQGQAAANGSTRGSHGSEVVGLTLCDLSVNYDIAVREAIRGGADCVVPSSIRATIVQTRHRILVAADGTAPGTCQRNIVLEHEGRHAAINDAIVADARNRLAVVLEATRPLLGPVFGRGLGAGQAAHLFLARLRPRLDAAVAAAMDEGNRRHAAMDTPDAYRRDWARCG